MKGLVPVDAVKLQFNPFNLFIGLLRMTSSLAAKILANLELKLTHTCYSTQTRRSRLHNSRDDGSKVSVYDRMIDEVGVESKHIFTPWGGDYLQGRDDRRVIRLS